MKEDCGESYDEIYSKYKNVVKAVKGEVLTYKGELITCTYFAISSGKLTALRIFSARIYLILRRFQAPMMPLLQIINPKKLFLRRISKKLLRKIQILSIFQKVLINGLAILN